MRVRSVALALAVAVTTFLASAAATIELLSAQGLGGPGVGILGVLTGVMLAAVAGVGVGAALASRRLGPTARAALVGYGTLGAAFLGIAALRYVNVPGADAAFSLPVQLAVSVALAVAAAGLTLRGGVDDTVGV